jgi:fatty-acyl-CoA synthase
MPQTLQLNLQRITRNTIGDAFHRAVSKHGDKEALVFESRRWTYLALDRAVNQVANGLLSLGLGKGDRVGAYGKNSDAYALLWLACTRAGLVHVPINYALTEGELKYIINQSGAQALFFDPAMAEHVNKVKGEATCAHYGTLYGGPGLNILDLAMGQGNDAEPAVALEERDVAQLLYTSGTTAAPKGAMMTHRALLAEYQSAIINLDLKTSDRALASLPLYHSAQMHVFLMPQLLMGATTLIIQAPLAEVCFQLIQREKITSFFAPPTVWISFLRHAGFDKHDLGSLEKGYYGASIMPVSVLQEMRQRLPRTRLYNCYGQSEIAPLATVLSPEDHEERPASAGRPVFNVETRVVGPDMLDMPAGELGEIVHRSPQAMVGYWDKPDQTEEAFADGWFHSGDVGYLDEGGYLYVVDRIKDIINTGGVVVSSRDVEECLYTHQAVSEVAVIATPDERWIEAVTAVVVLKEGQALGEAELIAYAKERIAPFKVPKRIHFVEELPKNTAGKLLKRELRSRFN